MLAKLCRLISDALDGSCFVIRLVAGEAEVSKGRVPAAFLAELRELVAREKLVSGVVRGQRQETYVRLVFSREIPPEMHQRLRNLWHVYEPMFRTSAP
jgi:hypothetical protein